MRHTLKLHGVVLGFSDLENIEPELGRARGRLRPGLGYDLVQPVFRLYAEAVPRGEAAARDAERLERYYKARDALRLELQDEAGRAVATNVIHVADYSVEDGPEAIELDVLIADESYWTRRARAVMGMGTGH